jgi:hypothetical protein
MDNKIIQAIIDGRISAYVSKTPGYNPYIRADDYDWYFEKSYGIYIFKDSYRGFNPYSGIETVCMNDNGKPVWTCDYVGYVHKNAGVNVSDVYGFLKESRGKHLKECKNDLYSDFEYHKEQFSYKLVFEVHENSILEKADIFYNGKLISQHIASGILKL